MNAFHDIDSWRRRAHTFAIHFGPMIAIDSTQAQTVTMSAFHDFVYAISPSIGMCAHKNDRLLHSVQSTINTIVNTAGICAFDLWIFALLLAARNVCVCVLRFYAKQKKNQKNLYNGLTAMRLMQAGRQKYIFAIRNAFSWVLRMERTTPTSNKTWMGNIVCVHVPFVFGCICFYYVFFGKRYFVATSSDFYIFYMLVCP